jgi:predicted RNA-binding Zn ribbon-like protein
MTFTFVTGNVALDFAGTVLHRDTDAENLLSEPRLLGEWSVAAGITDSAPAVSEAELATALDVREAIYRLARATATGGRHRRTDLDVLNAAATTAPVTVVLTGDGQSGLAVSRNGNAGAVVATVARAAVDLLGGPDATRIRPCEAAPCTRLFVDTSRAGSRRWCAMAGCGNRVKVAGFRSRSGSRDSGAVTGALG